jgi:uncharacterized protein YbjT (DUF2867 family)
MILVTGATGNVGGELVRALAARGEAVRALARNPDRVMFPAAVQVTAGDLGAPESLTAALAGVSKVFLLGGFATLADVLRRARGAGTGHVVLLTSRCVAGGNPENAVTRMWLESEAAVKASGVPWTILRPSGFQSNALRWLPQLQRGDVVSAPWPDVPIAAIDPADIAAVAATVLTGPGHRDTALTLSGPRPRPAHARRPGEGPGPGPPAAPPLPASFRRPGARSDGGGHPRRAHRRLLPVLQRRGVRRLARG